MVENPQESSPAPKSVDIHARDSYFTALEEHQWHLVGPHAPFSKALIQNAILKGEEPDAPVEPPTLGPKEPFQFKNRPQNPPEEKK